MLRLGTEAADKIWTNVAPQNEIRPNFVCWLLTSFTDPCFSRCPVAGKEIDSVGPRKDAMTTCHVRAGIINCKPRGRTVSNAPTGLRCGNSQMYGHKNRDDKISRGYLSQCEVVQCGRIKICSKCRFKFQEPLLFRGLRCCLMILRSKVFVP